MSIAASELVAEEQAAPAGDVADEAHAAAYIRSGAPDRVETWTVPGAGHTEGLATRPRAWDERVVRFLTSTLDVRSEHPSP